MNKLEQKIYDLRRELKCLAKEVCTLSEGGGVETDPVFTASPSSSITSPDIINWNDAASLAHEHANMITLSGITAQKVINWDNAFSWGNPSGTYVPIAGITTITGAKTFSETLSVTKSSNTDDSDSVSITGTLTHSVGVGNGITISPTINQTGTGGYNALLISPFEQAIGAGGGFLLNIGTNSAADNGGTHTLRFSVSNTGLIFAIAPTYVDNAAALSGGLIVGNIYKTATGELRIVV